MRAVVWTYFVDQVASGRSGRGDLHSNQAQGYSTRTVVAVTLRALIARR